MRIFRLNPTQPHRMRSILNGSRRYYIALALASAFMFSPLMLHTKAQSGFTGPGIYSIRSRSSGKMLDIDVSWRGQENGQKLIQWDSHGGWNQQFVIAESCGAYYTVRARHSGKLLDVPWSSTADGAELQQYQYNGGTNQQFLIEPVGSSYRLVARHSGSVLDVRDDRRDNGAQIVQRRRADPVRSNQLFDFIRIE